MKSLSGHGFFVVLARIELLRCRRSSFHSGIAVLMIGDRFASQAAGQRQDQFQLEFQSLAIQEHQRQTTLSRDASLGQRPNQGVRSIL